MSKRFSIEPTRGITAPLDGDNHIRARGRVRNKAMKKTKEMAAKEAEDSKFGSSVFDEFSTEEVNSEQ